MNQRIRKLLSSFLLLTMLCASQQVLGVRANPNPVQVLQPDGSKLWIRIHGDENHHFITTTDGYKIRKDHDGYYRYITGQDTDSRIARNSDQRSADDHLTLSAIKPFSKEDALHSVASEKKLPYKPLLSTSYKLNDEKEKAPLLNGQSADLPLLVILVNFADQQFKYTQQDFNNLLNQENYSDHGGTGSVRDYYLDNSMGQLPLQFDVLGPVTLDYPTAYYGGNGSGSGDDLNPREMIIEACQKAKAAYPEINFSKYDLGNDGYVDNVCVIFAGYSEASTGTEDLIWPHSWYVYPGDCVIDGVVITTYSCSAEFAGATGENMDGIGTFTHEFGHVLGLMDSYDSDYYQNGLAFDLGEYSLMASGSYNNNSRTPPYLMGFERLILGWCNPQELKKAADIELAPIADNQFYFINARPGMGPQEVFLLENRQIQGWDKYIPGHGMFITHLDLTENAINKYWANNMTNAYANHRCAYLKVADNIESDFTRRADGYPGPTGNVSFTADSYPAAVNWNGDKVNTPITDIREENGNIFFQVMGGVSQRPLVRTQAASDITTTSALLSGSIEKEPQQFYQRGFCWALHENPSIGQDEVGSVLIGSEADYKYELSSCEPASVYYYRSYLQLEDGSIIYGASIPFRTECLVKSAPLIEGFTSWSDGNPDCWEIRDENADGNTWQFDSSTSSMLYTFDYWNDGNDWLISPRMKVPSNGQLTFTRAVMSEMYVERLEVYVSNTTKEKDAFKRVKGFSFCDFPGYLVAEAVSLKEYEGQEVYVALVCKSEKLSYGLWIQNVYLTTPLQTPEKPQLENNEKGVLAKWNPIDNAKNYFLVVSEITNREVYETRLINDDEFSVMENTVPYSGSILFTQNGKVETTLFSEPLSDLKFLCIGSGAFGTSYITVEGSSDGTDWARLGAPIKVDTSLSDIECYWGNYLKNNNIRKLRFSCEHDSRNVRIQSLTLSMKSGYEHKLVAQGAIGNRTSYQIEDLNDGTRYGVTVTASDGTLYYQDSDEGVIDYVATGISNIQGQEIMMAVYDNRIILSGLDLNTKIECFDLAGHLIKSTLADRERMELDIQHGSGIYLLRLSNSGISKNYKVIIK